MPIKLIWQVGKRYFNNGLNGEKNDFLSNYDLYHLGSTQIDTSNTFDLVDPQKVCLGDLSK